MKLTHTAVSLLAGAVVGALGTYFLVASPPGPDPAEEPSREAAIHEMGHDVMPFSLDETTHVFEMTASGGIQDVVSDDPDDTEQIRLIRQHLSHEAMRFGGGDFSDPSALHGSGMPGLTELTAGVDRLEVTYEDLPAGARITFRTSDAELVTALHRWFGAQLSDHGADATYR